MEIPNGSGWSGARNGAPPVQVKIGFHRVKMVSGGMAERFKAAVLKTVELGRVPGVRIPLPPPENALSGRAAMDSPPARNGECSRARSVDALPATPLPVGT